MQAC
jgi:hypothetical protein